MPQSPAPAFVRRPDKHNEMALALRISAISVEAADLADIKKLIETNRARWTQQWLWSAEANEADVVVIDVDSIYGHMDWLKAQAAGRKIIALSNRPGGDDEATLIRPITLHSLTKALSHFGSVAAPAAAAPAVEPAAAPPPPVATAPVPPNVSGQRPIVAPELLRPAAAAPPVPPNVSGQRPIVAPELLRPAGSVSPVPPNVSGQRPIVAPDLLRPAAQAAVPPNVSGQRPVFNPEASKPAPAAAPAPEPAAPPKPVELTLVEYCSMDVLPEAVELARPGLPALVIDAGADCFYGPASLKALSPYCKGTIARDEWKKPADKVMSDLRQVGGGQPLTRLVWLATLVSSGGHLIAGLDLNARYKLARWPQIEREFPKHFRIATAMMKGPATLTEISEQSGAQLADVIDFINAYAVIGVAEMEGTPVAAAASEPTGLLARLRGARRS